MLFVTIKVEMNIFWILIFSFGGLLAYFQFHSATPPQFVLSNQQNIFLVKDNRIRFFGNTAFQVNIEIPIQGNVVTESFIITVAPDFHSSKSKVLQWGYKNGPLFIPRYVTENFFDFKWQEDPLFTDPKNGISIFRVPSNLNMFSRAKGLDISVDEISGEDIYKSIGYPVTNKRIPSQAKIVKKIWPIFSDYFSVIDQRLTSGKIWPATIKDLGYEVNYDDEVYVSDIDALPGSEGSPILNSNMKVVGVVSEILTLEKEGYLRKKANVKIISMKKIVELIKEFKKANPGS